MLAMLAKLSVGYGLAHEVAVEVHVSERQGWKLRGLTRLM
jgi:hypothetical protein